MTDGKHRLRRGQRERTQASTEAADQDDGAHQPPVVVDAGVVVLVETVALVVVGALDPPAVVAVVAPVAGVDAGVEPPTAVVVGMAPAGMVVVTVGFGLALSLAPRVGSCAAQSGMGMSAPLGP